MATPNTMQMTKAVWNHIHPDFKGIIDGCRYRMWNNGLVAVEIVDSYTYQAGDRVRCNGYDGAIIRHYSGSMFEVRLSRGAVCVDASELVAL